MNFITLGISHKTSKIETREKYYLSVLERELLLAQLRACPQIYEVVVLSTCNRTEVYALAQDNAVEVLFQNLSTVKKTNQACSCFYVYEGEKAIRHLFSVAAGLDSLVIGEKEILGQVKAAFELAREKGMLGKFLNILSNLTVRTGKLARTDTAISHGGSSVSWAAVEMARQTLGSLQHRSVLLIGAGKMSQLAAGDFKRKGVDRLYIMNRTAEKGKELAEKFKGEAVDFLQLKDLLSVVDVGICSAGAPHFLLEKDIVMAAMRKRQKSLLLIDISMPRNIHPTVQDISGVNLIGLDELDQVVAGNIRKRLNAVYEVEKIITRKMQEFHKKYSTANDLPGSLLER